MSKMVFAIVSIASSCGPPTFHPRLTPCQFGGDPGEQVLSQLQEGNLSLSFRSSLLRVVVNLLK